MLLLLLCPSVSSLTVLLITDLLIMIQQQRIFFCWPTANIQHWRHTSGSINVPMCDCGKPINDAKQCVVHGAMRCAQNKAKTNEYIYLFFNYSKPLTSSLLIKYHILTGLSFSSFHGHKSAYTQSTHK
jgi:hypothetical protein